MDRTIARGASAWVRGLPAYARNEVDPSVIAEVDALPHDVRRSVLAAWERAAAAGLFDAPTLHAILEAVRADHRQRLSSSA